MHRTSSLKLALLAGLMVPVVCLSMGGCPPTGNGNGNGNTTDDPIDVTIVGEGSVDQSVSGTQVTLTAVPDTGWDFANWSEADIDDPEANPLVVDSTEVTSITVVFVEEDDNTGSPTDSDGDGVRDEIDECPGTTRGTPVNAVGCPLNAPNNDNDNDGVVNTDDQCPNSPAGAPVDANGCAANERDTDNDGVPDNIDACERTPDTVTVDPVGCPVSNPGTPDDDADNVPNDIDQCPNTPAGAAVDPNGCAASQRDLDGDGVTDNVDQCVSQPGPASNGGCPTGGGGPVCGNGVPEAGEQCDDGNTNNGDGCNSACQTEGSTISNNNCGTPTQIAEGTLIYSNVGATTDGPDEPVDCLFFGRGDIRSDIWYCYTATCTGEATISLCGSGYDTKMAVYNGCACPAPSGQPGRARPIACSDDDCGTGADNRQSRVKVNVAAGQSYMVRVGGFFGSSEQGEGRLTIRCGENTCVNGTGSCNEAHGDDQPGCDNATCCNRVCTVDTFCCDVTWDSFCAGQAGGFCSTTGFPSCNATAGVCTSSRTTPGCSDTSCCNAVCQTDPYCCITAWDANCANQADLICAACGRGRGSCTVARTAPGCDDVSCCAKVCVVDEFCCNSEWDDTCVQQARTLCGR